VISGTNLGAMAADNEVSIGDVLCIATASNANSVTCTLGQGSYGTYLVQLDVDGKGRALHDGGNVTFQYQMDVTTINPTTGTLGGKIYFLCPATKSRGGGHINLPLSVHSSVRI
jgi:hypothetical protein